MVPLSKGITSYPFTGAYLSPVIQSFAHHLRHCRLLQVVALRCCMQGQHLTCQLLCLKLLRRSRRLAAAFFALLGLLPVLKKKSFFRALAMLLQFLGLEHGTMSLGLIPPHKNQTSPPRNIDNPNNGVPKSPA